MFEVKNVSEVMGRGQVTPINRSSMQVQSVAQLPCWRAVYLRQYTSAEMKSLGFENSLNCHVVVLDQDGRLADGRTLKRLSILNGWNGMRPDERPDPIRFEKEYPEAPANMPLFGASYWMEIADPTGVPSDRVTNITLHNPTDPTDPNGHHVSVVALQLTYGATPINPIPDIRSLVNQLRNEITGLSETASQIESMLKGGGGK